MNRCRPVKQGILCLCPELCWKLRKWILIRKLNIDRHATIASSNYLLIFIFELGGRWWGIGQPDLRNPIRTWALFIHGHVMLFVRSENVRVRVANCSDGKCAAKRKLLRFPSKVTLMAMGDGGVSFLVFFFASHRISYLFHYILLFCDWMGS